MPDRSDLPDIDQRTLLIAAAVAGGTALFAASKTVRVLTIAGVAAFAVYKFRGATHNPWSDVEPPRAR